MRNRVFIDHDWVDDQDALYSVYSEFFAGEDYPTDTLIGNVHLAKKEFLVEIEAVVALP